MTRTLPTRVGTRARIALALAATAIALLLAEVAVRLFVSTEPLGRLSYATADGEPITAEQALARDPPLLVPVPAPDGAEPPRPRLMFAPSQTFYLCYTDAKTLHRDWLDERGRVPVHINQFGLRDRDDLTIAKPAGERRILCLGDSFTFAWGIPEELGWVRLLETELRRTDPMVRTINCGASGTVCVDEYWWALQHRFHVFDPDAVVMTLCLNDLIPSSGLNLLGPSPATGFRLLDMLLGAFGRTPLQLDPDHDWVGELLKLPKDQGGGLYHPVDKPFEAMWSQGTPQRCMRAAKAWCEGRKIPFMVILWPFLQGLGPGRFYAFRPLHGLVAADCQAAGIPFLDVLPELEGTHEEDLWVTPADPHCNPLAQRLALPAIQRFVAATGGF
ncbi:MAG TPA: GDSL-type esterase/lipase family protein [Planctomycetota bacterium]|nr:GDSL-type esterase/lipase family protein [Planctomycetota bacterium]